MASPLRPIDCPSDQLPESWTDTGAVEAANDAGTMIIDERYVLLDCVGRGATGSVYRALDRTLDRHVAIKIIEPGQPQLAAREAQVLARVRHRNVVTIHDFGRSSGYRYLVLELLEGRDLRRWLASKPSRDEILQRFMDAGRGLAAAHAAGLVHRDFKPSNTILTNEGRVVVIDFGLARTRESLGELQERPGFTEGTLAYMAPELFVQADGDERSDQFAFCVALWEALAGRSPFEGDDPISRYQSIARGPIPAKLGVPRHVQAALLRGLSFSPDERFDTMTDLLAVLEQPARAERRSRRRGVLLSALAITTTFLFGWGIAPGSTDEAYSNESFNPVATSARVAMESSHEALAAGDTKAALEHFELAFRMLKRNGAPAAAYCKLGHEAPQIGDSMLEQNDVDSARDMYMYAGKIGKACGLSREQIEELRAKKQHARELVLLRASRSQLGSEAPAPTH